MDVLRYTINVTAAAAEGKGGHLHFAPIPAAAAMAAAAADFVSSDLTNGGCLRSVGVGQWGRARRSEGPTNGQRRRE